MNQDLERLLIDLFQSNCNSTSKEGRIAKILNLITNGNLLTFLVNEKKRLDGKDGFGDFEYYYGKNIINTVEQIYDICYKENIDHVGLLYLAEIIVVKYFSEYFQLANYTILKKNGLASIYKDFDDTFRGIIQKIHNINDTYTIIEVKNQKMYDTFKKTVDYYPFYYTTNKKDDGTISLENICFETFDSCLLFSIFGDKHSYTIDVLYNAIRGVIKN